MPPAATWRAQTERLESRSNASADGIFCRGKDFDTDTMAERMPGCDSVSVIGLLRTF